MSLKLSASIDVGYPIMGVRFVSNKTVLVAGGGGEGNNGIPNKITALKCSLAADPARRLQRFREITLPANEDSPQCLDTARTTGDDSKYSLLVGCNQSSQLIKTMSINNNLRKYVFTKDEHMRFIDAVQFEELEGNSVEDYPKIVRLSPYSTVGCFMTSAYPLSIYIFDPDTLALKHKFSPERPVEIKDFILCPDTDGDAVCYITASSINTVLTDTGILTLTTAGNKAVESVLQKYILYRVTYIDSSTVLIAAGLRKGKGAALIKYSLSQKKILKVSQTSKSYKIVVAMDYSKAQNLVAVVGNDLSVDLINATNFKVIKTFKKLHEFAITSVSFSPNGRSLATASAAKTLHVLDVPQNFARGKLLVMSLFQSLLTIILMAAIAIGIQHAHDTGDLYRYRDLFMAYLAKLHEYWVEHGQPQVEKSAQLSKEYGKVGVNWAMEQGHAGYQIARSKLQGFNAEHVASPDVPEYVQFTSGTSIQSTVTPPMVSLTERADHIIIPDTSIGSDFDSSAYSLSKTINTSIQPSATSPISSDIASAVNVGVSEVSEKAEPVVSQISEIAEPVASQVSEIAEPVISQVVEIAEPVVSQISEIAEPVVSQISEIAEPVVSQINEIAESVASQVGETAEPVVSQVSETAESVVSPVSETAEPVVSQVSETAEPVVSLASQVAEPIVSLASDGIETAVSHASHAAEPLISEAAELTELPVESANSTLSSLAEQATSLAEGEASAIHADTASVSESSTVAAALDLISAAGEVVQPAKSALDEAAAPNSSAVTSTKKIPSVVRAGAQSVVSAASSNISMSVSSVVPGVQSAIKSAENTVSDVSLEEKDTDQETNLEQEAQSTHGSITLEEEQREKLEREEQETLAKLEKEQREKEEEERAKLEQELLEQEQREQLEREQAELARVEEIKRLEEEEEQRARLEEEKLAKEAEENLVKEEQEKLAKEEQEKLAKEEQEQYAKEEQEQRENKQEEKRQQAEREIKVQEMLAQARLDRKLHSEDVNDEDRYVHDEF